MQITTIKQYENEYWVCIGYNGKQLGNDDDTIKKDIERNASFRAHELFVKDTNRYSSIPTPKFSDCKFSLSNIVFEEEESKYRVYTVKVTVAWQYTKSS